MDFPLRGILKFFKIRDKHLREFARRLVVFGFVFPHIPRIKGSVDLPR